MGPALGDEPVQCTDQRVHITQRHGDGALFRKGRNQYLYTSEFRERDLAERGALGLHLGLSHRSRVAHCPNEVALCYAFIGRYSCSPLGKVCASYGSLHLPDFSELSA